MNDFMLIFGFIMLFFCLYIPLKYGGNKDPRKQGVTYSCIFGIGVSISIIIESLNKLI
jgi:hypothetical protein